MTRRAENESPGFQQLRKWKDASTKVYLHSSRGGFQVWCEGVLKHVAGAEVDFGMKDVDGKEFLITIVTSQAKFTIVDNRDTWHFFAPARKKTDFGTVVQIDLGSEGRITLAELFSASVDVSLA
jgi:hypothetical protein